MTRSFENISLFPFMLVLFAGSVQAQPLSISMPALEAPPQIDGLFNDWSSVALKTIPLRKNKPDGKTDVSNVSIAGGVYGDQVYLYATWQDSSENLEHKPFVWSDEKGRYVGGAEREDRIAFQFQISGDYDVNWYSGKEFVADMWHWKSFRSNPLGFVHDKSTIISKEKMKNSLRVETPSGDLYIKRPSDSGDKLYKSARYGSKVKDKMPKYTLVENPTGSSADIKAKGVWKDGSWHVEMTRKLNTGHDDDVVFVLGQAVKGGIAVFDGTGDDDHTISEVINFKF